MKPYEQHRDWAFPVFTYLGLGLIALVFLLPAVFTLTVSIEPYSSYVVNPMHLIPQGFTLMNYQTAFADGALVRAFLNSFLVCFGYILLLLATSALGAFVLSRKGLPGRKALSFLFVFPLFFGGGLIPTFLLYQQLGLINSLWSLVLYGCYSTYWMLVLKAFFSEMPEELAESARIDGAKEVRILWSIFLPLAKAPLACIALMGGVWKWNEFFWAQIMMQDPGLYTFQVFLRNLFARSTSILTSINTGAVDQLQVTTGLQMAIVVVGILPILVSYRFIQRYFVAGLRTGAIKA